MPPSFWFNLIQVVTVPLILLAGMIWAAKAFKKRFTVRRMMVAVLLLGFGLGTARCWVRYNFATVYASGYSETQFRRVQIGMTRTKVESILGRPLRNDSISQGGSNYETWIYSEPPPSGTIGDNYWRRWVIFENGKVSAIVDDYYVD